ncbi:MAG TPA: phosphate acyltransferase PlsX [Candidatus Obscuribacterales bacterium]
MVRIAVDAMGGDYAPREIVHGAVLAAREFSVSVQLVGQPELIQAELKRHDHEGLDIGIVPASEVIAMDESAAHRAVAKKKDSSIVVATMQAADGKADAVVTAGSTAAAAAASRFYLGRIDGVERAPIAVPMPSTMDHPCMLLDGGAFHDADAIHLEQYALMGSILVEGLFNVQKPRVGILNIGTEQTKGPEYVRAAYKLLRNNNKVNFIGFVEARDFPMGKCDVLVCDGFSGNVALKTAEGVAKMIGFMLTQEIYRDTRSKLGGAIVKPALDRMKRRIDYNEFGGALLIGLKSVYLKAHGGSKHTAIKNAIRTARDMINANIVKQTEHTFSALVGAGNRK